MILKAMQIQGKTVFNDELGNVFYTMTNSLNPAYQNGEPQARAEQIVAEYMKCKIAKNNPASAGCGWSSGFSQKLEYRLTELEHALMGILVDEARGQIIFRGKQNGE